MKNIHQSKKVIEASGKEYKRIKWQDGFPE
jgi:hypothetical protein